MTRIARTALSMLASAALLLPSVAQAQSAVEAPQFAHDEIAQCYKASAVYFIFAENDDYEMQDAASSQVVFWLDYMQDDMDSYDAEMTAFENETAEAVQSEDMAATSASYRAKWAETYKACGEKWTAAGGEITRVKTAPAEPSPFTLQESQTCLFSTIAFMLVAARDENADISALEASGEFWANEADSLGTLPEAEETAMFARLDTMLEEAMVLETPEQTAAFLAPYQDDFTKCEALKKAATGE